jgi:hypothetical protein
MFACPDVRFSASHVLCGIVYRGIFTRHVFWRAYPATSSMTTGGCKATILILSSIGYKSIISRLTAEFFFTKQYSVLLVFSLLELQALPENKP